MLQRARPSFRPLGKALLLVGIAFHGLAHGQSAAPTSVTIYQDLLYGDRPCQTPSGFDAGGQCLDLYLPDTILPCAPTILWIHGGGWSQAYAAFDKGNATNSALCLALASAGYPVVSANYYLSDYDPCTGGSLPSGADYRTTIRDVKRVVGWIRGDGVAFGLPDELVVAGTSAGGHLAAMLATTQTGETLFDPEPGDYSVDLAILFSPPLNFVRMGCKGIEWTGARADCDTLCLGDPCVCAPLRTAAVPPGYPCAAESGLCYDSTFQETFLGRLWNPAHPPLDVRIGNQPLVTIAVYDCSTAPDAPVMPTRNPWFDASPYYWVNGNEPPIHIYQALCDGWVASAEGDQFRQRMVSRGRTCQVTTFTPNGAPSCLQFGCRHSVEQFASPPGSVDSLAAEMLAVIEAQFCP